MTQRFKLLLIAFMATTMSISCSDDTPKIEDISERATISGTISYPRGTNYILGDQVVKPLISKGSGKLITIEVTNKMLIPNMDGVTIYQTKSDTLGNYSIQVPITETSMEVLIKADTFSGKQRLFDKLENSYPIYIIQETNYSYEAPHTINKGAANVIDIIYKTAKK